jgi:oxygen-dependent protoporphyrinogen oxidase
MNPLRVVVIGGGIAGLSAAHALRRRARAEGRLLELRVLEAHHSAGGHLGSVREDGFVVERGPNGFLSGEPATEALIEQLGLGAMLVEARPAARRRFLVRQGKLRELPASPLGVFTTQALSLPGRLRLALEPWIPARQPATEESVFDFSRRRFGREAAELFADAIVAGTSAGDATTLSMSAAYPALTKMERSHGSLVRGMLARRRAQRATPVLQSFAAGMGTLPEALADELGPALSLGEPVCGLVREAAEWRVERASGDPLRADRVVLALPAFRAAELLNGGNAGLGAGLRSVPSAGLVAIALAWRAVDLARPLDGYGYLVPSGERLCTLGMVWESSLFPGRAPEGWVLVRMMLGGARAPGVAALPEPELFRLAEAEAARFLGSRRPPARAWLFRWPAAIPQYVKGHQERVAAIRRATTALGGLEVCGSSYDGISCNTAVASGVAAAERIQLT